MRCHTETQSKEETTPQCRLLVHFAFIDNQHLGVEKRISESQN